MSYFDKTYHYVKDENFEEWLKSFGLPEDKIDVILKHKPTQKIVRNGDSYVISQSTPKGFKEITFKSGVEFEDTATNDSSSPIKNTFTVSGNTVTQIIKSPYGVATFKREFNGDDLVMTITGEKYGGVAKIYFKA